jgi:thiosulfate dehydrogenase [quinone] large subunit
VKYFNSFSKFILEIQNLKPFRMSSQHGLSATQVNALVLLRMLIGWHFLYEGVLKLYSPAWTAKGYLLGASFLPGFFRWLASDPLISVVDTLNVAALVAVGLALVIGLKTQWAAIVGMGLLLLYYLAHPPFPGLPQGPAEGSYWIVNKNLIEASALLVLYLFPTETSFGIARLLRRPKTEMA